MNKNKLIFASLISTCSICFAGDYISIGTYGETTEVQPSPVEEYSMQLEKQLQNPEFKQKLIKEQTQKFVNAIYNVKTPSLTVGEVNTKEVNYQDLPQPLALVGCDNYSAQWLKQTGSELEKYKPNVYVVNCDDKKDYEYIKSLTKLNVLPINGTQIAQLYDLKHYPVLLTKTFISQ